MVDIEIVPADAVKYELDKATAYLHIDCLAIFEYLPRLYSRRSAMGGWQSFGLNGLDDDEESVQRGKAT